MRLGEKGEGIMQKKKRKQFKNTSKITDNSTVITRGDVGWGEVTKGKGRINGVGRRFDLEW